MANGGNHTISSIMIFFVIMFYVVVMVSDRSVVVSVELWYLVLIWCFTEYVV